VALAPEDPEEVPPPLPNEHEEVPPPSPDEPKEVLPPSPDKPEEVPPPPPDEPEEVPPPMPDKPEEALEPQPVAVVRARPLNADEATWSLNLFRDAFVKLPKVVVHLGVPVPNDLLQGTVKDYAFKINILVVDLESGVIAHVDDDDDDDGSLDGSDSDSDGGAPPVVTTFA
jgi:hypothetical protein